MRGVWDILRLFEALICFLHLMQTLMRFSNIGLMRCGGYRLLAT